MSDFRILHLTDLHLSDSTTPGLDLKVGLPSIASEYSRTAVLRKTMESLSRHLVESEKPIDAVVISGDITHRGDESGLAQLEDVLDGLGDARPKNERIAIVPGNHDVVWGTPVSSEPRYEPFTSTYWDKGYVLPYIDSKHTDVASQHSYSYIYDSDTRTAIIPINTANWCGSTTDEGTLYDVARVSDLQIAYIRRVVDALHDEAGDGPLTLIATAHHHLLPVSRNEEIKPFESMTNLEQVRTLLAEQGVDLYLHGHKHYARTYWDHQVTSHQSPNLMLLAAGSSLGTSESDNPGQVIELSSGLPPRLCSITPLELKAQGERTRPKPTGRFTLGSPAPGAPMTDPKTLTGSDVDSLYSQILATFAEQQETHEHLLNVVCHLSKVSEKPTLPRAFPHDIPGAGPNREEWLSEIVEWWQRDNFDGVQTSRFNHGSRIGMNDQVARMARALSHEHKSGRAVAVLLRPEMDNVGDVELRFPSLSLIQIELDTSQAGKRRLHAMAYFRKHEMRYWWPVNIGEITSLMLNIRERLRGINKQIELGTITTYSATAHVSEAPTMVAIPRLDMLVEVDSERERLIRLAYAVSHRESVDAADKESMVEGWSEVVLSLRPADNLAPDDVPVSLPGLEFLLKEVRRFATLSGDADAATLAELLRVVRDHNLEFIGQFRDRTAPHGWFEAWQAKSTYSCNQVEVLVSRILERSGGDH